MTDNECAEFLSTQIGMLGVMRILYDFIEIVGDGNGNN